MAPEVIQQAGYDFKADIWSLGVTAMEMVQGEPPNASTHPMKALFLIPKAPAPRLEGNEYSRNLKDFVAACLIKDPDRRPTAAELLQHKFIRTAGSTELLQELISRRVGSGEASRSESYPKYYAETLTLLEGTQNSDDWVFETVKALPSASHQFQDGVSPVRGNTQVQVSYAESMVESPAVDERLTIPRADQQIARSIVRKVTTVRRRFSSHGGSTKRSPKSEGKRRPLGPSLDFGNSASTVRQFQRLSEGCEGENDENHKSTGEHQRSKLNTVTKEALLGRRAFSHVIDPAFHELSAQTASHAKREHLSRVAQAWNVLNQEDAEGEYQLLCHIIDKIQRYLQPRYLHQRMS